ncbi:MAG: ATP-binding protein [Phycisphaerae bacterium]
MSNVPGVLFRRLALRGFRGFEELTLSGLSRVNLFAGSNNVGKTALLEGVFLLLGANNADLPLRLNHFRGMDVVSSDVSEIWGWLFFKKLVDRPIRIEAESDDQSYELSVALSGADRLLQSFDDARPRAPSRFGAAVTTGPSARSLELTVVARSGVSGSAGAEEERLDSLATIASDGRIELEHSEKMFFPLSVFVNTRTISGAEDAQRFGKLEEVGRQGELIDILKCADARVRGLSVYSYGPATILRADLGFGRLVPLTFLGQGFARLVSIALAVMTCENGCVLIDEFENGLHYAALTPIWRGVAEAASRANVQVFATTHSRECVEAAHAAYRERLEYDLAVFRLERTNDHVRVVAHTKETLDTATQLGWEVR